MYSTHYSTMIEGNLLTKSRCGVIGHNQNFQPKALHLDHSIVYRPSEPRAMSPLMSEEVGVVRPPRCVASRAITHDQYATIRKSFGEFPC